MLFKFKPEYKTLLILAFLNLLIRMPSINHSVGSYAFFDEELYRKEMSRLIENKSLILSFFKSGNMNILPVALILVPIEKFFDFSFNLENITIFARIFFNIFLNSISFIFLFRINKLLNRHLLKKNINDIYIGLLFLFNPYLFSNSRIWYANSYLYLVSIVTIYYLLIIYFEDISYNNLTKLILSISVGASIKYNYTIFFLCIFFLYINKVREDNQFYFLKIIYSSTLFIALLLAFNYSALINFEQFLYDFNFNIKNYGPIISTNDGNIYFSFGKYFWRNVYHALFLFVVPVNIFGFLFLFFSLYRFITKKNLFLINLFFVFPLLYILYISLYPTFLNRNINFLVPLILISLYFGIATINNSERKMYNKSSKILIACFSFIYLFMFVSILYDDFQKDSRLQAEEWIQDNLIEDNLVVGYNFGYTGTPARLIPSSVSDSFIEKDLDYYIFDDFWANSFFDIKDRRNILFVLNHKNSHFYYDSNYQFIESNLTDLSKFTISKDYELVKSFIGNGPRIFVFKKINWLFI